MKSDGPFEPASALQGHGLTVQGTLPLREIRDSITVLE